jgi:hypothetical protein
MTRPTIAAIFASEAGARNAVQTLHKAGFRRTWLGTTAAAGCDAAAAHGDGEAARFLSTGEDRRPLHRALIEHGVSEEQARGIEAEIAPGSVIVTVCGEDAPKRAAEILAEDAGDVIGPIALRVGIERRGNERDRRQTIATERGEIVLDPVRDREGFESEEFIATGRGYSG